MRKADRPLAAEHLQFQRRGGAQGALYCLVMDGSASMLRGRQLARAKGLLLAWTRQLYRQRAEIAVIVFAGGGARIVRAPGKVGPFSERWIAPIGGGGGSPVEAGLALAGRVLARGRRQQPGRTCGLWLLSDFRFAGEPQRPASADFCALVDFEQAAVPLGRAQRLAERWQADYLSAADWLG